MRDNKILGLALERPKGCLLSDCAVGKFFRLRHFAVTQQRLALFHQPACIGAAIGIRIPIHRHSLLIFVDGAFDALRAVVQRGIANLQPLGLIDGLGGAPHIANRQGTAGQPQQPVALGPVIGFSGRGRRGVLLSQRRRHANVVAGRRRLATGPAGERIGRRGAATTLTRIHRAMPALRKRSNAWRAFFGVSSIVIGEYSTCSDSAWATNLSAVAKSFAAIARRACASKSAVCCRAVGWRVFGGSLPDCGRANQGSCHALQWARKGSMHG